jgi:glycosyltransferase involved in cell wall biosynthesis
MYVFLLFKYGRKIKKQWGKPALLHSYIVIRGGLGGMLLGRRWKLPVILSEHWTIYYPEDPGFLLNRNYLFRSVVKRVFSRVHYFLPVTESLKQQVIKLFGDVPSIIVPNVVDTDVFCYRPQKPPNDSFRFIHISTMTYQKNPEGLLRSFKKFNERNPSSCLWMVGPYPYDVLKYARTIGLNASLVYFTGPVKYEEVALLLNQSNAFVLFSRYENLPCVVLEALCCGLPAISTAVGGLAEVIDIENGILLENENEEQLADALQQVFINYSNYNRENISAKATGQYNFQQVGKLINDVYNTIANTKQASIS